MAAVAKIKNKTSKISWKIELTNLMLGVYRAILFDANNVVKEKWEDKKNNDNEPDIFIIKSNVVKIVGGMLWWECIVSDPSDKGGEYECVVTVYENDEEIVKEVVKGKVLKGKGKLDYRADTISFQLNV